MPEFNWDQVVGVFVSWGFLLGKAVAVFIIGRIIAKLILKIATKMLKRSEMDPMLVNFAHSIANAFLMVIVVIAALSQLGIDTTSLIAVLASAGLAIGLALQDSMKNFASGALLLIFKPFDRGDYVEAGGTEGVVQDISLFSTVLLKPDNREVIIPNGAIWNGVITNYTARDQRRLDMVFGIGYGDDIHKARHVIEQVLSQETRILADPPPDIVVAELGDSSVNFYVRPWIKTDDYWAVKFAITEGVKLAFDEQGISIPFPQMDVHMEKVA